MNFPSDDCLHFGISFWLMNSISLNSGWHDGEVKHRTERGCCLSTFVCSLFFAAVGPASRALCLCMFVLLYVFILYHSLQSFTFPTLSWEVLRECIEKCEELGIKVVELLEAKGPSAQHWGTYDVCRPPRHNETNDGKQAVMDFCSPMFNAKIRLK